MGYQEKTSPMKIFQMMTKSFCFRKLKILKIVNQCKANYGVLFWSIAIDSFNNDFERV